MKKIYISLPISGRAIEEARKEAEEIAAKVTAAGFTPVSPFEVSPDVSKSYAEHMGADITALLECDEVWFAPKWTVSKGCQLERCAATIYGKTIKTL